ncbi:DUF481 domain-containing protein [Novosphingopyxis iocasae]|uniref:DUF481 domain-containing protein n=1 Tax=Novosphingopyxis iocasae TaxID=2762729 RepID=UPI00165121C7|nr:DUF481 domain-containing protein [Novosphingopyxis iocasae]
MLKTTILAAAIPAALLLAGPAAAQISEPLRGMLEAAIDSGNAGEVDTVAKYAKRARPDEAAEIDALVHGWKDKVAERKIADLKNATFLERWEGQGQLGFSRSTGGSNDLGLNAGLQLKRLGADWTHAFRSQIDYQKSNDVVTRERITAALESQFRFEDNAFAFGQAQYDRDRVQGIAQRFAISGGLGWTVVDDPGLRIALKGGPAYRYTDYRTAPNERVLTGLAALDGRWRIATGVTLTQHAETFVAAQNSTFASTTALDTSILGPLKARFSYTLDYQTQPPVGAVDLNTLSRASLVYDF